MLDSGTNSQIIAKKPHIIRPHVHQSIWLFKMQCTSLWVVVVTVTWQAQSWNSRARIQMHPLTYADSEQMCSLSQGHILPTPPPSRPTCTLFSCLPPALAFIGFDAIQGLDLSPLRTWAHFLSLNDLQNPDRYKEPIYFFKRSSTRAHYLSTKF